jgi:hypothetical protein
MKTNRISLMMAALWWACSFYSATGQAADKPLIESIEGDKVVVVKTPQGNRVGMRGTEINFGDRIKTGPFASAKILYPDGSKLLIGKATEMAVLENEGWHAVQ